MNARRVWFLATAIAWFPAGLGAQSYACLSASDPVAAELRSRVVGIVAGAQTAAVNDRTLYNLPMLPASQVTVVTEAAICEAAGAAYHAAVRPAGAPPVARTRLVVVKIGALRYVVYDANEGSPDFSSAVVFDKGWVRLAGGKT